MKIFAKPTCSCSAGACNLEQRTQSSPTGKRHETPAGGVDTPPPGPLSSGSGATAVHSTMANGISLGTPGHPELGQPKHSQSEHSREGHSHTEHTHVEHTHAHGGHDGHDHAGHHHHQSSMTPREEALFLGACAAFFFAVIVGEHFWGTHVSPYIFQGLYLIPYVLCGYPILREGFELILKKDIFNEFTLMGTASLVAILLGQTAEAVGVMLFYRIGEHVQERAAGSSRKNIEMLLATKPTQARLLQDGDEIAVPVEEVVAGQHIRVRAGEKIPLDGVIVTGTSELDQSPLTGESLPVSVEVNDTVIGGSINLTGALTIAVQSSFANSHMAKILAMVEEAAKRKSPTERFITRFARYYTPAVVMIALLVALVPPLFIPDAAFRTWVYRALVMLVISCPCALLISIPLGYFGGIGAASRSGILVKGGNVFDDILKIKSVVFDKTGTLTRGKFSVAEIAPAEGVTEEELMEAAIIAEMGASHPVALAIMDHAQTAHAGLVERYKQSAITSHEKAGKGMAVENGKDFYLAGTQQFLSEEGVAVVHNDNPGAVVYIAQNGRFLGSILVSDTIKKDSVSAVANLKARGLETIMLTGDREESAAHVAREIGIDQYRSGLLPDGKIESLQQMTSIDSALFVGDGINDAPILSMARVGVAMGEIGSEVAIEAADVVFLNDSPRLVEKLIDTSKAVRNIVWQNITFALGIKIIIMVFGIAGLSGLWEAIFADVGVALLAVLNSTRIIYAGKQ